MPHDQAPPNASSQNLLLVTGLSGAGKSTALRALEDLGWEVVDNLPISLISRLIAAPGASGDDGQARPLAVGIDSRTRGFDAETLVRTFKRLGNQGGRNVSTLFLDCSALELGRRFAETRRRHPLAGDRPIDDGVAREREIMDPLRRWADELIDTTAFSSPDLQQEIRHRFARAGHSAMVISVLSFGFARGQPRTADLVFDMRFLRNPYWDESLRERTGLDAAVVDFVRADPAYAGTIEQIGTLLLTLMPRYEVAGRSHVTVAFGCTGGRHRSVHVAEHIAETLRTAGYAPTVQHRNLSSRVNERLETVATTH
jgi:RNase adapter protein RapZ